MVSKKIASTHVTVCSVGNGKPVSTPEFHRMTAFAVERGRNDVSVCATYCTHRVRSHARQIHQIHQDRFCLAVLSQPAQPDGKRGTHSQFPVAIDNDLGIGNVCNPRPEHHHYRSASGSVGKSHCSVHQPLAVKDD